MPDRAISWLARKTETNPVTLDQIIKTLKAESEVRKTSSLYRVRVEQKGRKKRRLDVPSADLKKIQRGINRRILSWWEINSSAFGFSGGSVVQTISLHVQAEAIWVADIKSAFPNTFYEKVYGVFKQHYAPYTSYLLTLLTTLPSTGRLPQGAPTSPRLFDLSMIIIDREAEEIAKKAGGLYTRYADNLIFSGPISVIPQIEKEVFSLFNMTELAIHKVRTRRLSAPGAIKIFGLNIMGRQIHNTRKYKRSLRKLASHAAWLREHGMAGTDEFKRACRRLRGKINGFGQTATLPPQLLAYIKSAVCEAPVLK